MQFYDFEEKIKNYPVFTASEVKNVFFNQKNIIIQIAFWLKKGYLGRIKDGLYILSKVKNEINPMVLAQKIYEPSYLSLEFALNYYGIIPDIPGTYTSVTSRTTKYFKNSFGNFTYQKIKPDFFAGYETRNEKNISFNIATPEKALIDYLYLNKNKISNDPDFWKEMRIDEGFRFKKKKLDFYIKLLGDKKVNKLIESVLSYQKNAG
jgi:predicted transcriptional regulator of viral defense system